MILEIDLHNMSAYTRETLETVKNLKINGNYYKRHFRMFSCNNCALKKERICFYRNNHVDAHCNYSFSKATYVSANKLVTDIDMIRSYARKHNIVHLLFKNSEFLNNKSVTSFMMTDLYVQLLTTEYVPHTVFFENIHRARKDMIMNVLKYTPSQFLQLPNIFGYIDSTNKLHYSDSIGNEIIKEDVRMTLESVFYYKQPNYFIARNYDSIRRCASCRSLEIPGITNVKLVELDTGQYVCETCAKKYPTGIPVSICECCGHKSAAVTEIEITDELVGVFSRKKEKGSKISLCRSCKSTYTSSCNICGGLVKNVGSDYNYCNVCKEKQILAYGYKPRAPKFNKGRLSKDTKLYFGLEVELESERENLLKLTEIVSKGLSDYVYYKSDGSLDHGFEIVSEPMTYNFLIQNKIKFAKTFNDLVKAGGYSFSSDTTGVHVHLSKAAFLSKKHLFNFIQCYYLNKKFTEFIADRSANTYCHFADDSEENIFDEINSPSDRYRAVNLSNDSTVEVRIYKGNLKYQTILMYIQHCLLCYMYSKKQTLAGTTITLEGLKEYILKQNSSFEDLKSKVIKYKD